jgi:hypothetical protein
MYRHLLAAYLGVLHVCQSSRKGIIFVQTHIIHDILLAEVIDLRCGLYPRGTTAAHDEAEEAFTLLGGRRR